MAILIVDDSPDQRHFLRSILTKAGYEQIFEADSAKAALAILSPGGTKLSIQVDLIIMDALMPDIDGVEACRLIKGQVKLRDIPIIMVTAKKDLDNLKEAFSAGVAHYINKPVNVEEVLARVASVMNLKKEMDRRTAEMKTEVDQLKQKRGSETDSTLQLGTPRATFMSHSDRVVAVSTRTSNKIFIPYRREDSADVTGRIYDRLIEQFGREEVFLDVDQIPPGADFRIHLDEQVARCDIFLAIIGPAWIKKRGSKGKSHLDDSSDFVRIEVESALKRDIPLIPVLVRDAKMPEAQRLPASIQNLSYRNAIVVRADPDFHRDMGRLIEFIKGPISDIRFSQTDNGAIEQPLLIKTAAVEWKEKDQQPDDGAPPPMEVISGDFILLREAAIKLYESARGSKHLMAAFAEKTSGWKPVDNGPYGPASGSGDDILDWMATYIAHSKKKPIWGRKPPSKILEQISFDDVRKSSFENGALILRKDWDENYYFRDLVMRPADLNGLVVEAEVESAFHDP
ncbi:MAG TPA: response regulator [Nitrospira sp.]|nr:response regulator [Nitrospira sp.]